MVNSKN